jgi:hypothetical protein
MRGADVSSDHHLLASTVALRLKQYNNEGNIRTRYNVGLLRSGDTQTSFKVCLRNKFQALQDLMEEDNIEAQWKQSKEVGMDWKEVGMEGRWRKLEGQLRGPGEGEMG